MALGLQKKLQLQANLGLDAILGGVRYPVYQAVSLPVAPYAYYSTVRLSGWNGACCDVIRASDSATLTVGFRNNGLDLATLAAWGAGTTIQVTKWYDQSGNGFDATQGTSASQPTIVPSRLLYGFPAIHFVNQYLTLPAGVSTTQNALSAFTVGRTNGGGAGVDSYLELGTVPYYDQGAASNNFRYHDFGSTPNYSAEVPYDVRLFSVLSGATNVARLNEISNTITTASAVVLTGGTIGLYTPSSWASFGDRLCHVIYNSALSSANHTAVRNALYSAFNIYSTSFGPFIAWDGDSITMGAFNNYCTYVDAAMAQLKSQARCVNEAQSGETMASMVTNYAARVGALYKVGNSKNIVCIFGGTNDMAANVSAATAFSSLLSYCSSARTTGYKIVVATALARTQGFSAGQTANGFETSRQAYNASILADGLTHFDAVADLGAIAQMQDPTNLAYWNAGGIHPNDAGNALLAPVYAAAVNTLL